MSKKKERKIKRLQKLSIWPTILGMIITELVIFIFTVFICGISLAGIINSAIINTTKDCYKVVNYVNKNWSMEENARIKLEESLENFSNSYDDIWEIHLDYKNDIFKKFPKLENQIEAEDLLSFNENGVMYLIDEEQEESFLGLTARFETEDDLQTWIDFHNDLNNTKIEPDVKIDYNLGTIFKSFNPVYVLTDKDFISWSFKEAPVFHAIALYKTSVPDLNVCFKIHYKINFYQANLMATILLFFFIIIIVSGIYEIIKVISLVHEKKRVNKLVNTDPITGGKNSNYFIQKSKKEISRFRRHYAVVQLRLEKYRNYCTAYGNRKGENLLEELNLAMLNYISKKELVAHVEKSDFALLLFYTNKEAFEIRLRNLMNILQEKNIDEHLSFSAGVCIVDSKNDDVSNLLSYAGIAIPKEIKVQNEIVWFNDSMKEELIWERHIEDDMEKALENHDFKVFLQPKYSTKKEVLSAAEALVRWTHPTLGFISPGKFIPLFEKNGFILKLDDYMLTEVSRLQAEWLDEGKHLVPISVNVSRAHFAEENLAEHICSIVDGFNVPHEFIELELTESAFFDDKEVLLTTVRKLKSFGFKVSMDDFGAGYSSLNSLKELPLDIIKLDAEFFRSVDDISRSNLIVGDTITLAKKLGMQIVAEGIETREQVDFLAKQDCDLIQGFYFSKPLPVNEFEEKAFGKE